MTKTNAEYQREHRQRRARLIADLAAENIQLRAGLAAALAEVDRLTVPACQHPAPVVVDGTCQQCGAEVW